jgi:hypothetical protein
MTWPFVRGWAYDAAMKRIVILVPALVIAATAVAGPANATTDQQNRFMADTEQHGGLTTDQVFTVQNGQGTTLGDAVCNELRSGNAGANEVIEVANEVDSLKGSMSQSEVVVYWAITDLCPDQMGQRQDHWRDGG